MKVVVTNVFGPLNLGDFELFKKLINLIPSDSNLISAIARDPILSQSFFPDVIFYEQLGKSSSILKRIQYLSGGIIFLISKSISKKMLPSSQYQALVTLSECDLAVACPGGFLEDSSFSFYTHLVQLYLAAKLSQKVVLAPMSIGPARGWLNKLLLKFVLKKVDRVYIRELVSARLCDKLAINYELSNDLAFDVIQSNKVEKSSKALFTIINWNFPTSNAPDVQLTNYIDALILTAKYLNDKFGLEIGVIQQVASDRPAIDRFVRGMKAHNVSVTVEGDGWNPEQIMQLISTANIVIASRFHSAIFSLNMRTPVIPISYLPKTSGMLDLYKCSELYLDIIDLDYNTIIAKAEKILEDNDSYESQLKVLELNLKKYKKFDYESFSHWS